MNGNSIGNNPRTVNHQHCQPTSDWLSFLPFSALGCLAVSNDLTVARQHLSRYHGVAGSPFHGLPFWTDTMISPLEKTTLRSKTNGMPIPKDVKGPKQTKCTDGSLVAGSQFHQDDLSKPQ